MGFRFEPIGHECIGVVGHANVFVPVCTFPVSGNGPDRQQDCGEPMVAFVAEEGEEGAYPVCMHHLVRWLHDHVRDNYRELTDEEREEAAE